MFATYGYIFHQVCVAEKYENSLLTKITLKVGNLRDPVDFDHGCVPDRLQHIGHDARLLLLGHLHRVRSLGHRGKILDWTSIIISPRTATCQVRSDKSLRAFRLCQRGTSCLGPCRAYWTHRWGEFICRGLPCFSNWSHGLRRRSGSN